MWIRSMAGVGAAEVGVTAEEGAGQGAEGVEAAVVEAAKVDRGEEGREALAALVEKAELEEREAAGSVNHSRIRISRNRAPSCRHFQNRPRRTSRCSTRSRRARAAFQFSTPTTC